MRSSRRTRRRRDGGRTRRTRRQGVPLPLVRGRVSGYEVS
jgi:hypothetical protein